MDKKEIKESKFNYNSSIQIYWRIIKEAFIPNAHWFLLSIILMSLNASSVAYRAYLIKPAIDKVFLEKDINALIIIPIKIIAIAIFVSVSGYLDGYFMAKTTGNINIKYKNKLFKKLINSDIDYFQNKSSHKIASLFDDINGLMTALNLVVTGLVKQFFTMIGLIGVMFYQNFFLSCFAFVGFPVVILPVYYLGRNLKKIAQRGRDIASSLNEVMGESLNLIELVKSNSSELYEMNKFKRFLNTTYRISIKMTMKSLITSPMMELAGTIGFALVIWYGGNLVIKGSLTTGAFFTFITALFSIYKPAKSFAGVNIQIQNALTCAKRLFIVLDREPKIKDKENPIILDKVEGNIDFENITFFYPFHDKNEPLVLESKNNKLSNKIALFSCCNLFAIVYFPVAGIPYSNITLFLMILFLIILSSCKIYIWNNLYIIFWIFFFYFFI